jgi:hypothetical protein
MPRKSPEEKAADFLRAGKSFHTWRSWEGPIVRESFRQLPEWWTRRGGIFAWDDNPPDIEWWLLTWRWVER